MSSLLGQEGLFLAFCWAHVRRRFTDIEKNYPCECAEILDLIGELFHLEQLATGYDDLKKLREEKSKPLVKKVKGWLFDNQPKARGESHLLKAIQYTLNHWESLTLFLEDVRIPLNRVEEWRATA